jgi:hypothetical protein
VKTSRHVKHWKLNGTLSSPCYLGEFDFRWNTRRMNDGDRTSLAIQSAMGKRLIMQP